MLVMIAYNLLSRLADPKDGWGMSMFFIVAHVFICLVAGTVCVFIEKYKKQSGVWFLSSLLVLIIGFSTCVGMFTIRI